MKREIKQVAYSFEHGDESLPHLKDLVTDTQDPEKSKIITYLETHCQCACAGIIHDEINPNEVIGVGNIFSDGTYFWNDVFTNYVHKYNIPVPKEFREHILENYNARMKRHAQLRLVDCVEIYNNPYVGYRYNVRIYRNGVIKYQNNTDCSDGAVLYIKPEDTQYIIDPIMTEIFCYDADEHGTAMMDGYHWKLTFYKNSEVIDEIEGWPNEDRWRYGEVKGIIEFAERYIPKDLGSAQMNFYKEDDDE